MTLMLCWQVVALPTSLDRMTRHYPERRDFRELAARGVDYRIRSVTRVAADGTIVANAPSTQERVAV